VKTPFVQPTFDGARFVEHTLPVELAGDLAAYQTLVIELAKRLYLRDHPERQRVPRGFGSDFELHIERVEDGSSRPLLSLIAAGMLSLEGGSGGYFEQARDLIATCIAAEAQALPDAFPKELLPYFNRIGRSLRDGEQMSVPTADGAPATLTPAKRKALVLAADKVYEREVRLAGVIEEVDWEKNSFRLRCHDGNRVVVPMPASFREGARRSGGRECSQITLEGVGEFDSRDRQQKISSIEALEVQNDYQLASRLDELRALEPGWYDGAGDALPSENLDRLTGQLIGHYPEHAPLPALVPTPEGNLLMEWDLQSQPSVDIDLRELHAEFHCFLPDGSDLEREFSLCSTDDWREFLAFLGRTVEFA
jgi:hypothetical protein